MSFLRSFSKNKPVETEHADPYGNKSYFTNAQQQSMQIPKKTNVYAT